MPIVDLLDIMENGDGGVIICYGSYGLFGHRIEEIRAKKRWRIMLHEGGKHKTAWLNKLTATYVRSVSIEMPKISIEENVRDGWSGRRRKRQIRQDRKTYQIINLFEWSRNPKPDQIIEDTLELMKMAEARGINLRSSMGATASAMVRKSSEWPKGRKAATWEMEPVAKRYLPAGHCKLRSDMMEGASMRKALYIDRKSAHLSYAANQVIPAPESLRFRGFCLAAERKETRRNWFSADQLFDKLRKYVGLYYATIVCDPIPLEEQHLHTWWELKPGIQNVAIWSPELALLGKYSRLKYISGGLLSPVPDWAICEYATWGLEYREQTDSKIIKAPILAGIGMLGVNTTQSFDKIIVSGDETPERAEDVKLALYGEAYRASINRNWHPSIQNPIALGVIQAWTKTDMLLLGRRIESEGIPILQTAADAVIARMHSVYKPIANDGSPFIPPGWSVDTLINWRTYGVPTQVLCDNHPKTPGIPKHRQSEYLDGRPMQVA
jgi:hypothetical protein